MSGEDRVRNELLRLYLEDLDAGWTRSLKEYQARFPGHDETVAAEYGELTAEDPAPATASRFGRYRVLRELGRGGQGKVYLAEDPRLGRKIALKILTGLPLGGDESRLRFQREAQVASRLDDPRICTVYETGESNGSLYIAMRYVEGETLATRISAARNAGLTQIEIPSAGTGEPVSTKAAVVALFEEIACSLHKAHEAGVVHRDMKPGNIIITPAGAPVLLDFGLARTLDESMPALTRSGDMFGTPAYMAPEQIQPGSAPADRTADVYALGASLLECLTLQRPFDAPTREGLYRAILQDPPRDPLSLRPDLAGDLRLVILTALAKEPARRYQTAADLGEDLRRLRSGEPILARPPSRLYQARRFAARHRALVAGTLVLVVGLSIATVVTSSALVEAQRERHAAERSLEVFEQVLTSASHERDGRNVRLIEVLDESAGSLDEKLEDLPDAGARLTGAVGRVYLELGDYDAAEPLLKTAHEHFLAEKGPQDASTLVAGHALGQLRRDQARLDESEQILRSVLERCRIEHGAHHPDTLRVQLDLATVLLQKGGLEQAEQLLDAASAHARDDLILDTLSELANLRRQQGRDLDALALLEEVARIAEAAHGPDHTRTSMSWLKLAASYERLDRLEQAASLYRRALEVDRKKVGPRSPRVLETTGDLALVLKKQGKYAESEELYLNALLVQEEELGPHHPSVLNTQNNLGRLYAAMGRLEDAETYLRRAFEGHARRMPEHAQTFLYLNNLGMVLHDQGKLAEAETALRAALEGRERALDPQHPETLKSVNNLAYLLLDLRRFEAAQELFERSLEGRRKRQGEQHPSTIKAMVNLGWFHQQRRQLAEAERLYADALGICRQEGAHLEETLPLPLRLLVTVQVMQGKMSVAEPLARELLDRTPEGHPLRPEVATLLARASGRSSPPE